MGSGSLLLTVGQELPGKNYLDTIIGLPANLFYGTTIPTVILVLKKNRENKDILFIDAINDLEKNKNQNNLRDEDIDKIIKTYKERKDVEKYAYIYQEIGGSQYGRFHNRYYRSCSCCRCLCVLEEKPTD